MHLNESPSSEHVPPLLQVASSHWLSPTDEKKAAVRQTDGVQRNLQYICDDFASHFKLSNIMNISIYYRLVLQYFHVSQL